MDLKGAAYCVGCTKPETAHFMHRTASVSLATEASRSVGACMSQCARERQNVLEEAAEGPGRSLQFPERCASHEHTLEMGPHRGVLQGVTQFIPPPYGAALSYLPL